MLFIMRWLRTLLRLRKRRMMMPPPLPPVEAAAPPSELEVTDGKGAIVTEISSNRHERRALERARRKHDKFVTPKGVVPERPKPITQEVKPARRKHVEVITPSQSVNDAGFMIVDTHHEDRSEDVLYTEQELYGEFSFRDTILQQLELYFVYIDRMRKHDPDAYGYYKEIGATLMPYMATGAWNREETGKHDERDKTRISPLADWFNHSRPSFGCYVYGADPETEKYERESKIERKGYSLWVPKFMYFRKYKLPPPDIQMISGGDIYTMTVYWDKPFNKKMRWGVPQDFGIFISRDGKEVVALRHCDTKKIPIRTKHRDAYHKRGEMFSIPKREWHLPGEFERWARDHGEDPQHFITEMFKQTILHNEYQQYSMTRVTAEKDGVTAAFSVGLHRTAYFFQDRDIELTEDGKRKRIFHCVRPHTRHDGSTVKMHFRGDREFTWAGYKIKITIPGRDHFDLADMDLGMVDEYWHEKGVKYSSMTKLGKQLKSWMDEGKGKRA